MNLKHILFWAVMHWSSLLLAQTTDSVQPKYHFSGAASITNNGISLVPSFSLGRPAALFLGSLGGERFSFDPDIRFGLDGKPWTMLFWGRYKLSNKGRFRMHTGAHLGLNFRSTPVVINNISSENLVVRRYLAGELAPNCFLQKNWSIGSYYLYARGIDAGTVNNTHFLTLHTNFSHLPITRQFYARFNPQVFYLNQDGKEGTFFTAVFTLAKEQFPLSFSTIINRTIQSKIPNNKDFLWSLSLVYSFRHDYIPKPTAL